MSKHENKEDTRAPNGQRAPSYLAHDDQGQTVQSMARKITLDSSGDSTADILEHLKQCSANRECFDIYQMTAFRYTADRGRWPYYRSVLKSILALSTQLFAISVVIEHQVLEAVFEMAKDHKFCDSKTRKPFDVQIMANLLILVIIVFSLQSFTQFTRCGMYRINSLDLHNKPAFVNAWWFTIGRYVNIAIMLMVMWSSLFLIWHNTDPIFIVLKSSAMFFVLRLDDLFVQKGDYDDLARFLETYRDEHDYAVSGITKWTNTIAFYTFSILCFFAFLGAAVFVFLIDFCPI